MVSAANVDVELEVDVTTSTAQLLVDSRCSLGEGILWCDRRNVLYWTDILAGHLWRHDLDSNRSQYWQLPAALGCLALATDGRLLLGLAKGLYATDPEAALQQDELPLQLLCPVETDDAHTRINDGRVDRHGNFVFGTKSEYADGRRAGRYYQWSTAHGLRPLPLPLAAIPNAICFSPQGERIYFCDSPDGRLLSAPYSAANAHTGQVEVFVTLAEPGIEPDGAVVDDDGHLWNAHWGAGRVMRYTDNGDVVAQVLLPASHASCCVLGRDALYITSARIGLDDAALAQQPLAGAVFKLPLHGVSARVDRVQLP